MAGILTRKQIFTIPNMMSFFRILLIPGIVVVYCRFEEFLLATGLVIISGVTDILDGKIARKFNMISDFGKILDPIADKLTQAAIALSLQFRFPHMLWMFVLMFVKELVMSITGALSVKYTGDVYGANWHGKVTTVLLYVVMVIHMLWAKMPMTLSYLLSLLCVAMMMISMYLYASYNIKQVKKVKQKTLT